VPSDKSRTRVGVGELVDLTCTAGAADWTMSPQIGSLSATNGETVTYTAPATGGSVTFTATVGSASATLPLTIVPRRARVEED